MGVNYALYDRVGRVTQSSRGGTANYQQYTYDSFGNMMSQMTYRNNAFSGGTYFGGDSSRNRSGFQYDDAGSVITDHFFYSYDALGMQTTLNDLNFNNASFVYTADDERIWSYDPSRGSFWRIRDLAGNALAEFFSPDNNPQTVQSVKDYVYRDGILVGASNGSASPSEFYHVDHLGTPRVITTAFGGGVMATHDYFAFGEPVTSTCDGETLGFNAKERDADTPCAGYMLNFHAREYGRLIGRFLSVDTAVPTPWKPQTWNRYTYAHNNPLNYLDPDGRDAIAVTFPLYMIRTDSGRLPGLGHSGIITIDKQGHARYFEYGRYGTPKGITRELPNVPSVQFGKNSLPTPASMDRLLAYVSTQSANGSPIRGGYFKSADAATMNEYAESRMLQNSDPNRKAYDLMSYSCNTFVKQTLEAGGVQAPSDVGDPRPFAYGEKLAGAADVAVYFAFSPAWSVFGALSTLFDGPVYIDGVYVNLAPTK